MAHSIGKTIAGLRKAKGWTQVELAEKLGVSDKAVSKWESEGGFPDITLFPLLAKTLGVNIDFLMTGIQEVSPSFMSRIEYCAKTDDPSMLPDINTTQRDENGKTLADYVLQYESVKVFSACPNLRFSKASAIKMALLAGDTARLEKEEIKSCVHVNEKNLIPGTQNAAIITDELLELIVDENRVSDKTFHYLLRPKDYKIPNVWYMVFPYLIHICCQKGIQKRLDELLAEAEANNQYAKDNRSKSDSSRRALWVNLANEYAPKFFGIVVIKRETIECVLGKGDFALVERLNAINRLPLPISKERYVASPDEIRIARLRSDKTVSAEDLTIQSALHCGVLCIDEILATNDYKIIKKALDTYPVTTYELQCTVIEGLIKNLEDKDWRKLFEYAVDSEDKKLIACVLARNVDFCRKLLTYKLDQIGNITYPKGAESNAAHMKLRARSSYGNDHQSKMAFIVACKKQILDDCSLKLDMAQITSDLNEEYFKRELAKGNFEIVIIKLCVRMEAILRSKYHLEGDFSEMLTQYCSKYGREDDGWGYDVEAGFVKHLHKLRKCRNSIVHSEATDEALSIEELNYCIDYICKMG